MQVELDLIANLDSALTDMNTLKNSTVAVQTAATQSGNVLSKSFQKAGADSAILNKNLNQGVAVIAQTNKKVQEFGAIVGTSIPKATNNMVSFRKEISQATLVAKQLADQFGEQSVQAINARKRVGELKEQFSDFQKSVEAFNPERKFQVFSQLTSGLAGGFAGLQGAMALFGDKSEDVEKVLLRVNAALAFSQGINSLLGLGDVFKNFAAVLGFAGNSAKIITAEVAHSTLETVEATAATTAYSIEIGKTSKEAIKSVAATKALTVAKEADVVATEAATVATKGFTAVLNSNIIFVIIGAIAALAAAFIFLTKKTEEHKKVTAEDLEKINKQSDALRALQLEINKTQLEIDKLQGKKTDIEVVLEINTEEAENKLKEFEERRNEILLKAQEELNKQLPQKFETVAALGDNNSVINIRKETEASVKARKELFDKLIKPQIEQLGKEQELLEEKFSKDRVLALEKDAKEKADKIKEQNDNLLKLQQDFEQAKLVMQQAFADLAKRALQATAEGKEGEERLKILRDIQLQEISDLEKTLQEKVRLELQAQEKINAARQGRAEQTIATPALSTEQEEQLNVLRAAVQRNFLLQTEALEVEHQRTMLAIIEDGNTKQLAEFELSFKDRADKLRKAGATEEEIARVHQRELAAINNANTTTLINAQEKIATAVINQRERGKEDEIAFEKQKALDILNVQLVAEQQRLSVLLSKIATDDSILNDAEIASAQANVKKLQDAIQKAIDDATKGAKKFSFSKLLGIDLSPEDEAKVNQALESIGNSIVSITNNIFAEQQAIVDQQIQQNQELIDSLNARINEEEQALQREMDLQRKGYASNVDGKKKELALLKAERDKDLANQRTLQEQKKKLAKEQAIFEFAQQASSIIAAGANIIEGWSTVPFVGAILGIAAAASMVAAFFSLKSKIASSNTLAKGGLIGGKSHADGGNKFVSIDGNEAMEHEYGEYAVNKQSTKKYFKIIDAINRDKVSELSAKDLSGLLKGTGVTLNKGVEKRISSQAIELHQLEVNHSTELRISKVEGKLDEIHETINTIGKKLLKEPSRVISK